MLAECQEVKHGARGMLSLAASRFRSVRSRQIHRRLRYGVGRIFGPGCVVFNNATELWRREVIFSRGSMRKPVCKRRGLALSYVASYQGYPSHAPAATSSNRIEESSIV